MRVQIEFDSDTMLKLLSDCVSRSKNNEAEAKKINVVQSWRALDGYIFII